MSGGLAGRVALVTGAAKGIGAAVAARLDADGAVVVAGDIDRDALDETTAALGNAEAVALDVTDPDAVTAVVEQTVERHGRIDILVNNAGIYPEIPWDDLDLESWRRIMAVNLDGTFIVSKAVTPHMKQAGYGRVVNLSSELFQLPPPNMVHYVASKGGIIGFTRALATELGSSGITVNAVAPGLIATDTVMEGIPEDIIGLILESQAVPRLGQAADVASLVAYLASEEAGFITGSTITVGGGRQRH